MADKLQSSFTGTGVSDIIPLTKTLYNVSVYGMNNSTVHLERRFQGETNWGIVKTFDGDFEGAGFEVEQVVDYRFRCETLGNTTEIFYRLARKGNIQ